jgi:hypothetical protein
MSVSGALVAATGADARHRLYSGELLALTQIVHALAKTLASESDSGRQMLVAELQARLETLQQVHDLGDGGGETGEALVPLALLINELS